MVFLFAPNDRAGAGGIGVRLVRVSLAMVRLQSLFARDPEGNGPGRRFGAIVALVALALHGGLGSAGANELRSSEIRSAVEDREWKVALDLSRDWTDSEPESADAHLWLAVSFRTKIESVSGPRALFSVPRYRKALERAIELDPMHVLARQERIGYLIFAPGIAGGNLDRARDEISALREIDAAAADEMQELLDVRVERKQRGGDPSDG
jgi:hypothetical protein